MCGRALTLPVRGHAAVGLVLSPIALYCILSSILRLIAWFRFALSAPTGQVCVYPAFSQGAFKSEQSSGWI